MKKIFLMLAAGVFCTSVNAQVLNEGFEGETFAPEGWTTVANHSYPSFSSWNRAVKSSENPKMTTHSGQACAFTNPMEGADNYLITPQLRPESGEKLIFWARVDEYAKGAELQVLLSTTGNAVADFTEVLGALPTTSTAADPRLFKEWQSYQIPMDEYVGQKLFIAFRQYDQSSASKIYLDDISGVTLAGSATCPSPYGLTISNVKANSATFAWEGEGSEFQYCCVSAGSAANWAGAPKTTGKSVTLSSLAEATAYEFYVRAYCSDEEQSLAPNISFKTICQPNAVPWIENFAGHPISSGFNVVAPECWIVSSEKPQVAVVASKNYDDESDEGTVIAGSEYLLISGGGPTSAQTFAMPAFNVPVNTLEVAFDYCFSYTGDAYGKLEAGYMTNAMDAKTFVSFKTLAKVSSSTHAVVTLDPMPDGAQFVAFRFSGGTSELGAVKMDNFVVAEIGKSGEVPQGISEVQEEIISNKYIQNGQLIIERNGVKYNAQGAVVK